MGLANLTVRIGADISRLQKKMFEAERTLRRSGRRLSNLGNELSSTLTVAIGALGVSSIKAAGDIEALGLSLQSALEGKLGDAKMAAEAAKVEMELLRKEALKPGLEFEQALKGSVRLQSVGFSAQGARETLASFGNALSLAGGRASDLDGVTLALTQIISKGKISAEEINQLAERVPQVRRAISNVFGTSDSEALQKLGVGVEEFVQKTTTELAKLPQAQSGIRNTLENIAQGTRQALAGLGTEIAKAFDLQGAGEKLVGAIEGITNGFKNLSDPMKATIVRFGAFLALIGPAVKILGVYKLLKASLFNTVRNFTSGIVKNTAALRTNILAQTTGSKVGRVFRGTIKSINAAMKANPIGLVITALEFLAIGFGIAYAKSERFRCAIAGLGAVAKEVFTIIVESVKQFTSGFKKITEGNILDGLKDISGAIVKSNPVG
ncbi:MAG: tape measure protein, partial [Bacteroidota bacterium]